VVERRARINNPVVSVTPQMLKTHGMKSSTVWTFCELQMALTLRCVELDELFFEVKQTNSLCLLEMW
jgi:hypothetical protein